MPIQKLRLLLPATLKQFSYLFTASVILTYTALYFEYQLDFGLILTVSCAAIPYALLFLTGLLTLTSQKHNVYQDRFTWCAVTTTLGAILSLFITPIFWLTWALSSHSYPHASIPTAIEATFNGFMLSLLLSVLSWGLYFLPLIPILATCALGKPSSKRKSPTLSISIATIAWCISATFGWMFGMAA